MKFSDRMGITKPAEALQLNSMNEQLKNSLWNLFYCPNEIVLHHEDFFKKLLKFLKVNFFKESLSSLPLLEFHCKNQLEERFMNLKWYDVYNIFELIYNEFSTPGSIRGELNSNINKILEKENSGYRLLNGSFIPITNDIEIESIRESGISLAHYSFNILNKYITNAISLLSKKPVPDYRNSIKESISAVEGICKKLTEKRAGGIKEPLKELSKMINIHPALAEGYLNIYGYTCDESGIRHPLLEDSNAGFAEAKYMLVSCSAFVNYILEKNKEKNLIKN